MHSACWLAPASSAAAGSLTAGATDTTAARSTAPMPSTMAALLGCCSRKAAHAAARGECQGAADTDQPRTTQGEAEAVSAEAELRAAAWPAEQRSPSG